MPIKKKVTTKAKAPVVKAVTPKPAPAQKKNKIEPILASSWINWLDYWGPEVLFNKVQEIISVINEQ